MQYLWIVNLTERILIMQFSNLSVKISSREIQLKSSRCIRFYKLLLNRRNIENVDQRRSILERVKLIPPFLHFFFAFNLTRVPMIMIRWSSACIVCSRFRRGYRGLIPLSILGIATAFKLPPCHVSLPFCWPPQNHEGRSTLLFSLTYLRSYVIYPPIWYVDGTTRGPGHSYDPTIPHIGVHILRLLTMLFVDPTNNGRESTVRTVRSLVILHLSSPVPRVLPVELCTTSDFSTSSSVVNSWYTAAASRLISLPPPFI